jgi:hypothetical protein
VAVSMAEFARELRSFDNRRVLVRQLRRQISKPLPAVKQAIARHAVAILPKSGGLGAWVAASKVIATVRYGSARSAGIRVKGGRKSLRQKSDVNRIDAGRVRAPSWGHRTSASWHTQSVPAGWFSDPVLQSSEWISEVERAVDTAFNEIRG